MAWKSVSNNRLRYRILKRLTGNFNQLNSRFYSFIMENEAFNTVFEVPNSRQISLPLSVSIEFSESKARYKDLCIKSAFSKKSRDLTTSQAALTKHLMQTSRVSLSHNP